MVLHPSSHDVLTMKGTGTNYPLPKEESAGCVNMGNFGLPFSEL